MLEVARSKARPATRAHLQSYRWGIVDVILGVLMLPFALWFWLIEGMVRGITTFGRR